MKNRLRKVQFKFLDYVFENMRTIKSKHYPDSKFFKKGDKVILELEKSGTLWVLYSVWSNISDTFSFEYEETQQLIKEWMEEQLKSRVVAPKNVLQRRWYWVEEQIKSGEIEPDCNFNTNIIRAQEELKSVEVTPRNAIAPPFRWRKLNSAEVLPQSTDLGTNIVAEEKLELLEIEPDCNFNTNIIRVQEEIKSAEITPDIKGHSGSYWVESRLKLDEITPQRMNYVIIGGEGEELESEEVTPRSAIPPQSWTNLKSEEIKPVKFYENELQVLEEQLKQEILKLSKDEKK